MTEDEINAKYDRLEKDLHKDYEYRLMDTQKWYSECLRNLYMARAKELAELEQEEGSNDRQILCTDSDS